MMPPKSAVVDAWRAVLTHRLQTLLSSQDDARSGTRVDGEHRPSNRGERAAVTSQGYLAHAFGERAVALQASLDQLEDMGLGPRDEVVVGALLEVELNDGEPQLLAILPGGDATLIHVESRAITVLSAASPLARQLRHAEPGEVLEVDMGPRVVEAHLTRID